MWKECGLSFDLIDKDSDFVSTILNKEDEMQSYDSQMQILYDSFSTVEHS
ncbi:MAG: hypothetical protein DGJ47_000690 [Rickettsiaceae bacterium]